jgi:hypothetical protein
MKMKGETDMADQDASTLTDEELAKQPVPPSSVASSYRDWLLQGRRVQRRYP